MSADVRWEWVCPVTNHWRRGAHWSRSMGESRRSSPSNPKCGSTQNWGKSVKKKFSGICDLLNEWLIFQTRSVLNICLKEIISYASRSVWAMHICAFTLWEWSNAGLSDFSHQMKLPFVLRTFNPFHSWSSPSDSRFVWSQRLLQAVCSATLGLGPEVVGHWRPRWSDWRLTQPPRLSPGAAPPPPPPTSVTVTKAGEDSFCFLIDFPECSHLYHKNNNLFLKCVQKLVVKNRCCCMRWDNTNAGILFLYPIVQFPLNCKDRDTFEKCNWKAAERRCRRGFSLRLFRENRARARLTNNCIIVFGVSQQQSHQDRMENQKFAP